MELKIVKYRILLILTYSFKKFNHFWFYESGSYGIAQIAPKLILWHKLSSNVQ